MRNIQAAIFDVDGTLFDYHEMKIHESTVDAIRALKEKGITVVVATARSYAELSEDLLTKIAADYYVTASGHSIQDSQGRILLSERFTYGQVERIKDLADKYDTGLTLKYELLNCLYRHPMEMQQIYSNIGQPRCPSLHCPAMDLHRTELPIGFTIRCENGLRDQFCLELAQYPGEYRIELFGNGIVAEIYTPFVNKMTALKYLVHRLGIPAENCVAFGDSPNDMEMIRWAGTGVAMGNSCQDLMNVADTVCAASWEDGIAQTVAALLRNNP